MAYNEIEQRGTADFPFAFFHVDFQNSRYHMSAHWHSEMELIRVLDGELHVTLNHISYVAKAGDIILVNTQTVHQATPKDCVYECIVFHGEYLYAPDYDSFSFIKSLLDGEYMVTEYFPQAKTEVQKTLNSIFDAIASGIASHKFRVIAAFYNFFADVYEQKLYTARNLESHTLSNDKSIAKLKKVLSYIRDNYDQSITLEMIAKTVNMSPKYLGCFFKKMTQKTPIGYLNEYRTERAAYKLRNTDLSVTDIAYSCGFSDLSYFIKTFKCYKGISPGKFRNT